MKFYLSSYKLGNEENVEKLKKMISGTNKRIAYIANALDYSTDAERRNKSEATDIDDLSKIGLTPEKVDLRDFFGKKIELKKTLEKFDILWVRGGNTFVLRQAMKLSGFDEIIKEFFKQNKQIIYGGYSAGACILAPTLKGLSIVDSPNEKPYGAEHEIIWDGLGILDYSIAPHYKSDHPESTDVDKEVQYMTDEKISFRTLQDGEVIIIE